MVSICRMSSRRSRLGFLAMKAPFRSKPNSFVMSMIGCWPSRYASRINRLHRFLTTAPPRRLPAMKATLIDRSLDAPMEYLKSISLPRRTLPEAKRPVKAFFPLKIAVRGSLCRRINALPSGLLRPPLIADRQAVTAFSTATTQYFASVCGLHALAESVRIGALALAWLVRTFHVGLSGL